jgi:pimeloyl-ACP methyl ester carboxylesterase
LRRVAFAAGWLLALSIGLVGARALAQPTGLQAAVTFTNYPALAQTSEVVRRVASPLTAREMRRLLAASGKGLNEHSVDLAEARFIVYVPSRRPPAGYGLMVFVPPVPRAELPQGWGPVFDRFGVIFVSADGSGNEANPVSRRVPLALIAAANLMRRYDVDPARVYAGGFSGGAHVAQHLAMAYPDLFRGAMLDAGSDPIGDAAAPLPPKDLFASFQASTRLVYVTGEKDISPRAMVVDSISSMRHWCVFDLHEDLILNAGHRIADPAALARALSALDAPRHSQSGKLAACRSGVEAELTKALDQVRSLNAAGKRDEAHRRLLELDARFGGLAAPASLDLAGK